jgi:drug/metabolite transporter (DMT)-like permease
MLQPRAHRTASIRLVWLALVTVYIVWGSTYLGIKVAVETMPPFLMAGGRFLVAGLLLFAWDAWAERRRSAARDLVAPDPGRVTPLHRGRRGRPWWRSEWAAATLIGGLLLLGGNGGVVWGEAHHVASGVSALIFATLPMWMALLSFVLYRERLSPMVLSGLALGFAGTVLLVGGVSGGASGLLPPLIVLGGAVCWSLGSVLTRWAPLPERQTRSTAMQMICGGGLLLLAGAAAGELGRLDVAAISARSWTGLVYLILVGSLIGFTAYTWLLPNARISLISTYAYVNPIVAVFLGWIVLGERISGRTLLASAVVVAAVAIVVTGRSMADRRERPDSTVPEPLGEAV